MCNIRLVVGVKWKFRVELVELKWFVDGFCDGKGFEVLLIVIDDFE